MDRMNDQERGTFYGKQSSTSRSSDEHTASEGSEDDVIERSAKQARYVDWYQPKVGENEYEQITEDQRENMADKPLKQVRFKDWQVQDLVADENDGSSYKEEEAKTMQGVAEFEERQAQQKNQYLTKLANGNELAMIHLGTINEDEDEESEGDEKSFDEEAETRKRQLKETQEKAKKAMLAKKKE